MSQLGFAGPNSQEIYSEIIFRNRMNGFTNPSTGTVTFAVDPLNNSFGSGISNTANKPIASHIRIDWPMKVKGIVVPKSTALATGEVAFNLGIWTATTDGSNNWSPGSLVSTGLQGELVIATGGGNTNTHFLTFNTATIVPPGDYFIGGCYRCNGTTAGAFTNLTLGMKGKAQSAGFGRYDMFSSGTTNGTINTVNYTNGTIASLFSGISWVDASTPANSASSINWGLWVEQG
jgi:hypothetical protein